MDLADIMATTFATVSPETSLANAARRMIEIDTGASAVIDGERLVGMISERDLLRHLSAGAAADALVADRMTTHVLTAGPSTTLPEAMAMMVDGHFRHLPIVGPGSKILGVFSVRDALPREIGAALGQAEFNEQVNDALG